MTYPHRIAIFVCLLAVAAAGCSAAAPATSSAPGGPDGSILRFDPTDVTAKQGSQFTVRVVEETVVPTAALQASVTFDPTKLQVIDLSWGDQQRQATIHFPDILEPVSRKAVIDAANRRGKLDQFATAFAPPAGIPTGDSDFLVIVFKAAACGGTTLGLPIGPDDGTLLDGRQGTVGQAIPLHSLDSQVNITC